MATKSSKIHVYIFMALIFFLCLLAFSVGTFVGKSVTESEMKKNQAEIFNNINDREVASVEEDVFDDTPEINEPEEETLSKEEIDALAEEFNNDNDEKPDPNLEAVEEKKVAENKVENESPINDITDRIANDESATKKFKSPRKPSSILPNIGASLGKYTIQLASYTNENEAQKHAEDLKKKGYSAFYISAKVRGKDWYRVSVGLFDDSKKANQFRKGFVKKTNLEASIVQKITR